MNHSKTEFERYLPPLLTDTQRYWFDHLQKQQSSDLSMAAYAKDQGLPKHTLYWWSQQLRIPKRTNQEASVPVFQAVKIASQPSAPSSIEMAFILRLPNGIECELQHANAATCVELLQSLLSLSA